MSDKDKLRADADGFASRLNDRIGRVLGGAQPRFGATVRPGRKPRVMVAPADPCDVDQVTRPLTMEIASKSKPQVLHLRATYYCCYDTSGRFLTIEESQLSVGLAGVPDPLFRVEYARNLRSSRLPAAHVQVHAHRDEITYLMAHADEGRPQQRWRNERLPRLSELHLPVGGDRFRPCLEDVIWFTANEFGIRLKGGGWKALEEGRAEWRCYQLRAAVTDAPAIAAEVLRDGGWTVTPGPESDQGERPDRLRDL